MGLAPIPGCPNRRPHAPGACVTGFPFPIPFGVSSFASRRMPRLRLATSVLLAALLPAGPGALANPEGLACHSAIAAAEREHGIPEGLLQAIGVVESGQRSAQTGTRLPWPFAVNLAGEGQLAPTREAAIGLVQDARRRGTQSIDVGCLQVNLAHHPQAFASLEQAFDPLANARYAGQFLALLRARTGGWDSAVAHYHSASPDRGGPYQARVLAQWAGAGPLLAAMAGPGRGIAAAGGARDAHAPLWSAAGMRVTVLRPTTQTPIAAPTIPALRAATGSIRVAMPSWRG